MWPSTSKHLRILREAGVVVREVRGPCRLYRVDRSALGELAAWIRVVTS